MENSVSDTMRRGDAPIYRRRLGDLPGKVPSAWAAFNIAVSAVLYLFDFVTNVMALRTYYFYSVGCQVVYTGLIAGRAEPPTDSSAVLLVPSHCFTTVFYVSLSIMVAAHLSNTLIFWFTLEPSQHPLRLAYFLPVIHLSRLLRVLWRTCSCTRVEDLQDRVKETSTLYNVLAAAFETTPQLMLQFHVILEYGIYNRRPDNSLVLAPTQVSKTLMLSIFASLVSGTYNGSMAVLCLLQNRGMMPLQWIQACIVVSVAGLHTLTAISTKTLIAASLAVDILPVVIYLLIGLAVTWIFFAFVVEKSQRDSQTNSENNYECRRIWMIQLHSLTLAHVSLFIGPMYVIVKLFDRPACFLIWGTLLHIFVELLGFGAVVVTLGAKRMLHWPGAYWATICYDSGWITKNVYLSCKGFMAAVCPLILLFLVSTLVFANMVAKRNTNGEPVEHQLAANSGRQDEHRLAVLDAVSNQMETCIAPTTSSMPNRTTWSMPNSTNVELGSPNHIHSLITYDESNKVQELSLLPSIRPSLN